MKKTAHPFTSSETAVSIRALDVHSNGWLLDSEISQLSPATIENRRIVLDKLLWFLRDREYTECGIREIKEFLAYVSGSHKDSGGRWGNPQLKEHARPSTVSTYYARLRTFFRYLVDEEIIDTSPVEAIKRPVARQDQVQPFTREQVQALVQAARHSSHRRRDEAIVLFLLDSGVRASELCGLKMKNLDMEGRKCTVLGKGNKRRMVCFGKTAAKALWQYLREDPREAEDYLFYSDRGTKAGEGLTRSGLRQLIERLGKVAGIQSARCSPHTFRHTFAVEFLRGGGNVFSLKELLGHTPLVMVNRYVALAQADLENQHRQFSPADRLNTKIR